jgi:hypothetical protein
MVIITPEVVYTYTLPGGGFGGLWPNVPIEAAGYQAINGYW